LFKYEYKIPKQIVAASQSRGMGMGDRGDGGRNRRHIGGRVECIPPG